MDYQIYSYRYAKQIIEHPSYKNAYQEITGVIRQCPLFIYPNKSSKNKKLNVVQQLQNTYFDRRFACDFGWTYRPSATNIKGSSLAADFRKNFKGLRIQTEVQFGNMSRWYSDIFKFQTAYSQDLIDIGLSIVPMSALSSRMDSNVVNFERCLRELPSAKLSITLPILMIGLSPDSKTQIIDISTTKFRTIGSLNKTITGKGTLVNRYRIINGILNGIPVRKIGASTDPGLMASFVEMDEDE